jgi:hypothetical protein
MIGQQTYSSVEPETGPKQSTGAPSMVSEIPTIASRADPASTEVGTVVLRGVTVPLDAAVGQGFILDCARNIEGLLSDQDIKSKYELSDSDWEQLATNTSLHRAVRAERERRILSGEAPREAAQTYFAKAPGVLRNILNNELVSPRHRIEAAKELRQAAGDQIPAASGEKFTITIVFGDVKHVIEAEPHPLPLDAEGEAQ